MTLEIEAGAPPRTSAVVPAQTRVQIGRYAGGQPVYLGWPTTRPPGKTVLPIVIELAAPRNEPLDRVAKRLYASAGVGVLIAAAAAAALHSLGWPMHTTLGKMLGALLILGVTMFTGGGITGSARPRSHHGGPR